jgi:NitT/TauT family transport system permease protein
VPLPDNRSVTSARPEGPSEASEAEATAGELSLLAEDAGPSGAAAGWRRRAHGRRSRWSRSARQALPTAGIVVGLLIAWYAVSALDIVSAAVVPAPGEVFKALIDIVQTGTFWDALKVTVLEISATFVGGVTIGFAFGMLFWKAPLLGQICEPYLISFYAVPFIVFYPVLVVVIGLNSWPIIILATVMAVIPMSLNTWIGMSSVPRVYWKLAASLVCGRRQTMFRIAIPAAAHIVLAGVRLAMIYSLIGSVSMEFLLAPNGLGYQIRNQYELFNQDAMTAYVVVVFLIAGAMAICIALLESWVLGRRRPA